MQCVKTDVNGCGLAGVDPSIWGKIMIPMYWLWLHCLYGLHGFWCQNVCSKLIWSASPAMQCLSYDPVDMWCHQGTCQLTRYPVEDAAWWAGELGTLHLAWPCRTWWWLAEEIQKLNPRGGHGHGHPKETWPEETHMDCLELGLTESHPSNGKEPRVVNLEVSSSCTHPTLGTN